MRSYQLDGLNWLIHMDSIDVNGILADKMGLGKTRQAVAMMAYLKFTKKVKQPMLTVAPLAVLGTWEAEYTTCPSLKVLTVYGYEPLRSKGPY